MEKKFEVGLLILRLVLGITFFVHGVNKFQSGIGNVSGWFDSIGIPGFLAYLTATVELVGGIALVLGFGTRVVSFLFIIIMLVAIVKVKLSAGFLGNGKMSGYELDLALMAMSLQLGISGSRLLAFDQLLRFETEDGQASSLK